MNEIAPSVGILIFLSAHSSYMKPFVSTYSVIGDGFSISYEVLTATYELMTRSVFPEKDGALITIIRIK